VSCGEVNSQAREMVTQRYTATLVAATLVISRSSLYYGSGREAAGLTEPTTNRSSRHAEKSWRTAIGEWRGGYGGRKVCV